MHKYISSNSPFNHGMLGKMTQRQWLNTVWLWPHEEAVFRDEDTLPDPLQPGSLEHSVSSASPLHTSPSAQCQQESSFVTLARTRTLSIRSPPAWPSSPRRHLTPWSECSKNPLTLLEPEEPQPLSNFHPPTPLFCSLVTNPHFSCSYSLWSPISPHYCKIPFQPSLHLSQ